MTTASECRETDVCMGRDREDLGCLEGGGGRAGPTPSHAAASRTVACLAPPFGGTLSPRGPETPGIPGPGGTWSGGEAAATSMA